MKKPSVKASILALLGATATIAGVSQADFNSQTNAPEVKEEIETINKYSQVIEAPENNQAGTMSHISHLSHRSHYSHKSHFSHYSSSY